MTELTDTLRRTFEAIASRPIPHDWVDSDAVLAEYRNLADLVDAIRDWTHVEVSDGLVRALLPLARRDDKAALVLLEGTVRLAISQVGGTTSVRFRDELITDLACVILESEDLIGLDRLVDRISKRAYRRTKRRLAADSQWVEHAVDLEWGIERLDPVRSPEEIVVPRLHLEHVYGLVNRAIESGELANYIWDDFRAGTLAPQLGYPRSDILKHRLWKRAERVRTVLAHAS
jgi:hypothetical protein